MPVASNSYVADAHTQADGRRYVTETHVLTAGAPVVVSYLAAVGADYAAIMAARVDQINESLAEQEAQQIIEAG
jgi:hypothetical protein